jgi:hypothetical protein
MPKTRNRPKKGTNWFMMGFQFNSQKMGFSQTLPKASY